jgi:bifunctional non-homologous end joining protein LigD
MSPYDARGFRDAAPVAEHLAARLDGSGMMGRGLEGPCPLVPMAGSLVRPPFRRDGFVYEEKVDGWRMLAYKNGRRVRLISRNAVDHTARFRELAAAIAKLRAGVFVFDGEVAVYDEKLVSRFHLPASSDP